MSTYDGRGWKEERGKGRVGGRCRGCLVSVRTALG